MSDIKGPFEIYEYEQGGGLAIIDATTRIVLDDVYAYDKNDAARQTRMTGIARALSICYGAKPDPAMARVRELLAEVLDAARWLATDTRAPRERLLRKINAIADEANLVDAPNQKETCDE